MNREFLMLFLIMLIGFSVLAYVSHKFVGWLFGDTTDQENK